MSQSGLRLVIIILHFGDIADTRKCLESLQPDLPHDWKILLIDNGTGTNAAATLQAEFPDIVTLGLTDNLGWAGGNNTGIKWAQTKQAYAVCLLNNDTLTPVATLKAMLAVLPQVEPCLLHPAIDYADPTEGAQLDPAQDPARCQVPHHPGLYELDFVYGACLMVPMSVIERTGSFDERLFLQLEETDFFIRARNAAIPSYCLNSVRIVHFESRSFGARVTPQKLYYIMRNRLLLWEKHDRSIPGLFRLCRNVYWRAAIESATPLRWLVSRESGARAIRAGIADYSRRRFGSAPDYPFFK